MSTLASTVSNGFNRFGLHEDLVHGIRDAGFETPRPIQLQTIPAGLDGRDVLGLAHTGTGKTAAFALPLLDRLLQARRPGPRALVLAPTRELATQIAVEIRAATAVEAGHFGDEIEPVPIPQRKSDPILVTQDEHPRPGTTMEDLARLKPVFKAGGTVTAGNCSGINDGASALLVMDRGRAERLGLKSLARIVTTAVSGVDPAYMGMGPVDACRKLAGKAGIDLQAVDLFELNEAFASQSVACIRELGLDPARVNVNGGAIALGHPLGCSGARILTTLVHELRRRGGHYGIATMCIGVGQGIATLIERT